MAFQQLWYHRAGWALLYGFARLSWVREADFKDALERMQWWAAGMEVLWVSGSQQHLCKKLRVP